TAAFSPSGHKCEIVACSSAGGGLRLAVVGYEELISAEAGHRAALSAGARVLHVAAGRLGDAALSVLRAVAPDAGAVRPRSSGTTRGHWPLWRRRRLPARACEGRGAARSFRGPSRWSWP